MRSILTVIAVIILTLSGCKSSAKPAKLAGDDKDFQVPAVEMSEWPDAIRLSNGDVNLFVIPSIGRIMRFGYSDGPNVLWTNPKLRPRAVGETVEEPAKQTATTKPVW